MIFFRDLLKPLFSSMKNAFVRIGHAVQFQFTKMKRRKKNSSVFTRLVLDGKNSNSIFTRFSQIIMIRFVSKFNEFQFRFRFTRVTRVTLQIIGKREKAFNFFFFLFSIWWLNVFDFISFARFLFVSFSNIFFFFKFSHPIENICPPKLINQIKVCRFFFFFVLLKLFN